MTDGAATSPTDSSDRGKRVVRISVQAAAGRRHLCRARNASCAPRRQAPQRDRGDRRHRLAARPAQRAERGLRRRAARWRSASSRERAVRVCASFPGLAHRMEEVGRRGNVLFVNDFKATNADSAAQALAVLQPTSSGSPAASRRPAASPACAEFFPRIRKAYLIGEAAEEFAGTLGGNVPHEISQTLDVALASAARDAEASGAPIPWCCCRRPAPRSTSTAISRSAARVPRPRHGIAGRQAGGVRALVPALSSPLPLAGSEAAKLALEGRGWGSTSKVAWIKPVPVGATSAAARTGNCSGSRRPPTFVSFPAGCLAPHRCRNQARKCSTGSPCLMTSREFAKAAGFVVDAEFIVVTRARLDEIVDEIFRKLFLVAFCGALSSLLAQQTLILWRHELTRNSFETPWNWRNCLLLNCHVPIHHCRSTIVKGHGLRLSYENSVGHQASNSLRSAAFWFGGDRAHKT